MIIVDVETRADPESEEVRRAATGEWVVDRAALTAYGDGLLAVREGRVVGAYRILGHRTSQDERVCFELQESSRLAFLIGRPMPVRWSGSKERAQVMDSDSLFYPVRGRDEVSAARRRRRTTAAAARRSSGYRAQSRDRPRVAGEWPGLLRP